MEPQDILETVSASYKFFCGDGERWIYGLLAGIAVATWATVGQWAHVQGQHTILDRDHSTAPTKVAM